MTEELRKSLERIRDLTPKLNTVTNEASASVQRVEEYLAKHSVGLPASVWIDGEELPDDCLIRRYLCYDRVGTKFRIAVETKLVERASAEGQMLRADDASRESRQDIVAWSSCPRDLKLSSIRLLPDLLDEIANEIERVSKEAKPAIAAVKKVAKAMNGK